MEMLTFFGRVMPSNVGITIPRSRSELVVDALGLRLSIEFDVVASDLVAITRVEGTADLPTIRNYVVEGVSTFLDAAGVLEGLALSLEMRSVALPDGQRVGLDPRHGQLATVLGGLTQEQMLAALNAAPTRVGYVLRDLRFALADPATSAFWCYRAIETVSRHWAPADDPDDKKNKRWPAMYAALGDNQVDVLRCKALADRPRHGHNEALSATDREQALAIAWTVLGRYARFLTEAAPAS
ncbi:hypothetical protein AB0C12_24355 [Actinoplanes sp. NPDC048967]|uniref:hypothetical protein n=1 Tax=Actinoplanes sp. NPDC048967 TaxID=3155269 RepID=UPI0033C71A22